MRCSRTALMIASVLFVPLCLAGHVPIPTGQVNQPDDQYKDSMVWLEAFMVEIKRDELYNLGVPIISQDSESVTIGQILTYLKKRNPGSLKAAARLEVAQDEQAETDSLVRQGYYTGGGNPTLEYGDFGTYFGVRLHILSDAKLCMEATFKHSALMKDHPYADKGRPAILEKNWSSRIYLQTEKPTIVWATQNEGTAAFLIVTAGIRK